MSYSFSHKPKPQVQGALGMSGGQWSANWQYANSSKCMHLLQRLISIGAAPFLKPISNGRVGKFSLLIIYASSTPTACMICLYCLYL